MQKENRWPTLYKEQIQLIKIEIKAIFKSII